MEYRQRIMRMIEWFQNHNYSQYEGEYYFSRYPIDTLEVMFGLSESN